MLPKSHIQFSRNAKREKKKDRAKGRLIVGIKKEWGEQECEYIEN